MKLNEFICKVYIVINCVLIGRYIVQRSVCKDLIEDLMHLCRPKTLLAYPAPELLSVRYNHAE